MAAYTKARVKYVCAVLLLLLGAVICTQLGMWQLDRLKWKTAYLSDIAAQQKIDPWAVPLAPHVDDAAYQFHRGFVAGHWQAQASLMVGPKNLDGQLGYWVLTPLVMNNDNRIWVVRGWADPLSAREIALKPLGATEIMVAGTLRLPEVAAGRGHKGPDPLITPQLDLAQLAAKSGGPAASLVLYAEAVKPVADVPALQPLPPAANIRNEHANYARFWFGFAALFGAIGCFYGWRHRPT